MKKVVLALSLLLAAPSFAIDFYPIDKDKPVIHGHKNEAEKIARTKWTKLPCKHCHGTGHVVVVINKGNTSYRLLKPCPWCKGTGTRGTSKK